MNHILGRLLAAAGAIGLVLVSAPAALAHFAGTGARSGHIAGSASASPRHAATRSVRGPVKFCVLGSDSTPDATFPNLEGENPVPAPALDITSFALGTDGANVIARFGVANLADLTQLSTTTPYGGGDWWWITFTDAENHTQFLLANYQVANESSPVTGWAFETGYEASSPQNAEVGFNGGTFVTGSADYTNNFITITAPFSAFVMGDFTGTTVNPEPVHLGDRLQTVQAESWWNAGAGIYNSPVPAVETGQGLQNPVDADSVTDPNNDDGGWTVATKGC